MLRVINCTLPNVSTHTEYTDLQNAIFLAGPCPRNEKYIDWRNTFIKLLQQLKFDGDIINPTNSNYENDNPKYYTEQCLWEQHGMAYSSCVVFWCDFSEDLSLNPGLTTRIEIGMNFAKLPHNRMCVGVPYGSYKSGYIEEYCNKHGIHVSHTLEELANDVLMIFKDRKPQYYFTSDTHFSSDRTFTLSKRPFLNVDDMDMNIVNNWNKKITMSDIVYFLGDFGDYKYLSLLNYKQLHFIKGNYERENLMISSKDIVDYAPNRNIIVYDSPVLWYESGDYPILLSHEPINPNGQDERIPSNAFNIYGHAHRSKYKRNGTNVAVDCNHFTPVSYDNILFDWRAIEMHYDDNVFSEYCEF